MRRFIDRLLHKLQLARYIDRLLHKLQLARYTEFCSMLEDVANDFRHESDIKCCVVEDYQQIYSEILHELINSALLSDNECRLHCECKDCSA